MMDSDVENDTAVQQTPTSPLSLLCHSIRTTMTISNYQCDSSFGFSVIVRVTFTGFIIFQLQLQLKLTKKMLFSYS